jgi:hypothetical protein
VSLQVLRGATVVASPPVQVTAGSQTLAWPALPDGAYTVALTVTDDVGVLTRSVPLTIDATPPRVTVLSYRGMRFRLSEPATLVLTVGGTRYRRIVRKATATQFWLKAKPRRYVLTATDAAGNVTTVRYRG